MNDLIIALYVSKTMARTAGLYYTNPQNFHLYTAVLEQLDTDAARAEYQCVIISSFRDLRENFSKEQLSIIFGKLAAICAKRKYEFIVLENDDKILDFVRR